MKTNIKEIQTIFMYVYVNSYSDTKNLNNVYVMNWRRLKRFYSVEQLSVVYFGMIVILVSRC